MRSLSIREARKVLTRLEGVLAAEGEVTITRRGKAIARVIPIVRGRAVPSHKALRDSIPHQGVASETLVREDRERRS